MLKSLQELIAETTSEVRVTDARNALSERADNGGLLIDVREPIEAQEKSPTGSKNIPRGVLEMKISALCPSPDAAIYLHCASGGRARLAAEQLRRMGYRNVTAISCPIDTVCEVFNND